MQLRITKEHWPRTKWLSLFCLLIVLLFSQVWFEVRGFTIRSEDILIVLFLFLSMVPFFATLRIRRGWSYFHAPLFMWILIILMGFMVSLIRPFPDELKKDAVVNGIRLILAISLFFVTLNLPVSGSILIKTFFYAVVLFSLVTTAVAVLQISFWEGWLPVRLPLILVELKEGANQAQGREIFALFIGNTGTHVWSAMLSFQILTVSVLTLSRRNILYRVVGFTYLGVLFLILFRTSVRNSLLGVVVAVVTVYLIQSWRSKYQLNRLAKLYILTIFIILFVGGIFTVAPDTYYVTRIRQAIPHWEDGSFIIKRGSNIYGRIDGAEVALQIFSRYPLTGAGFSSYGLLSARDFDVQKLAHAHNSYLNTLAELGIFGFFAVIWLTWRIGCYLYVAQNRLMDDPWFARLWYVAVGGTIFMLTTAMFANPFGQSQQVAFCLLLIALLVKYDRSLEVR